MSNSNKKIYTCLIVVLLFATACNRRQISQVAYHKSVDKSHTNIVLIDVQTMLYHAGIADCFSNIEFFGQDTLDWGVDETDAEIVWGGSDGATSILSGTHVAGRNVKVAIIDSGLDRTHRDFEDTYVIGINYVWVGDRSQGIIGTDNNYDADTYHGTHVAGIIAANDNDLDNSVIGVAPKVDLYIANVYNDEYNPATNDFYGIEGDWVTEAIKWATLQEVDVISMSLGQIDPFGSGFNDAIEDAYAAGIVLVAASGNFKDGGDSSIRNPATNLNVIAVGAIDENGILADNMGEDEDWNSCFGNKQELVAPGVNILSTIPGDLYDTSDGTSFAAPMVTGVCALLIEKSRELFGFKLPPEDIRTVLALTAIDLGVQNRDDYYGWGEVNAKLAIDALETDSDGDNLIDILEEYYGTNPLMADSDGDTLLDGDEVYVHKTSPTNP
ncbi:MAG: S8 family serine peptidase, partial [Candidatus Heimdallarchaeaceae archaeon]